jgi:hypothetical protein
MTLLAEREHLAADQHPVIDRPVWNVTGQTLVLSEWDVLEHKRSLFIRVTSQADRIASPQRLHCLGDIERSMLLMAVAAVHASFRHFVMKWSGELGANFTVTVVTQSGRVAPEDVLVRHLLMRIVTVIAGDDINVVLILVKPALADALLLVALGAHSDHFARRGFAGVEDVTFATGLHVLTPWAVAHLAPLLGREILWTLDRGKVRRAREPSVLPGMTRPAGSRPNVILSARWLLLVLRGISRQRKMSQR